MLKLSHPRDVASHVGEEHVAGRWLVVTEEMILAFGKLTGDEHWVHADAERVRRETPYPGILAHGYLTLSLVTGFLEDCWDVQGAKRWINYGLEKVRFPAPVTPGAKLRLRMKILRAEPQGEDATRIVLGCAMEMEGSERPACAAECITIAFH